MNKRKRSFGKLKTPIEAIASIGVLLMCSCSTKVEESEAIYKTNDCFVFIAESVEDQVLVRSDTIILQVANEQSIVPQLFGQTTINWIYPFKDKGAGRVETTGVKEVYTDEGRRVFLHPPRLHYLMITELGPFPEIETNKSYKGTGYTLINKGYGDWDKKKIKKTDSVNIDDIKEYELNDSILECTVVRGVANETPEGRIKTTHYFNDQYGFVKMKYQIEKKNMELIISMVDLCVEDNESQQEKGGV